MSKGQDDTGVVVNGSREGLGFLQKFALYFFSRARTTATLALLIACFGVLSYTTLLTREGFPVVNIPYAMGQAVYFVGDAKKIDEQIAKPVSDFLLQQPEVKTVHTSSLDNQMTVVVQYKEGIDAVAASDRLQAEMAAKRLLPESVELKFEAARTGFTARGDDAVVSFFLEHSPIAPETEMVRPATEAAKYLQNQTNTLVKSACIISPIEKAQNPLTGQIQQVQGRFERYGERVGGQTRFYSSVPIGLNMVQGGDAIRFNDQIHSAIDRYNQEHAAEGYTLRLSASFAPSIRQQIGELQKTLLEGLLAVLVIGSIVVSVRASIITVLSMVMVILATLGLLKLVGYTLNTVTLSSLILGLSLIVDDTIIVVEAIDAQRKQRKKPKEILATAIGKVGRAMIAATATAALSFAPLLFVGGLLGSFIRLLPVTIISALLISLVVALVFIPFFARLIMLKPKHIGRNTEQGVAAGYEARVARWLAAPMLWACHSKRKLGLVGAAALMVSFLFIGASGFIFQKVAFNIFPPSKDTNQIYTTLQFAPGTTVEEAAAINDQAMHKVQAVLGSDFVQGANYGMADAQSAKFFIQLTDYNHRSVTAPQYLAKLRAAFKDFPAAHSGAKFTVHSKDVGPPPADFAARIMSDDNRAGAEKLAAAVADYIRTADIRRSDGSKVRIESVGVDNTDILTRADGKQYVGVTAKFLDTDTTALVTQTKSAVEKEFGADRIVSFGLPKEALTFDFGQEGDNQDSFKTLALAFPIVLLVIYLLLAVEFRSLLQPLLIFMAIPFSLFGITFGLWLTDNSFSFFAMLGFFALIGLSLKNTILLTDYANQARQAGSNPVEAAYEALSERFRPLIATSLTAIVSLIPLALASPFWQGLAVVLIFGLLSSTFLVVTVFPYYYLGGEFVRGIFRRQVLRRFRSVH